MGRTKHYVSSTVYNLAGDEKSRPDFVQVASIGRILSGSGASFGATLTNALLGGPGLSQRRYFKWAKDNYVYGVPSASRILVPEVPMDKIQAGMVPQLGLAANVRIRALTSIVDMAEAGYWVDAWVRANRPDMAYAPYDVFPDGPTQYIVHFSLDGLDQATVVMPADYVWGTEDKSRKLLYVLYQTITENVDGTSAVSDPLLYTYRLGSGNVVFDSLQSAEVTGADYFPVIPLREHNTSISHANYVADYASIKKAYKKLTGSKVENFLETLEANESIGDLDFAYIAQGVSLSTKNNEALGYLYQYFKLLSGVAGGSPAEFSEYIADMSGIDAASVAERRWLTATDPANTEKEFHPLFGSPLSAVPLVEPVYEPKNYSERYFTPLLPSFDWHISWKYIVETEHYGNAKNAVTSPFDNTKLRRGDYWSGIGADVIPFSPSTNGAPTTHSFFSRKWSRNYLYHQVSQYRYTRLEIVGLRHQNNVYQGHSVYTTGRQALEDGTANEPSGFIVPFHYPSLKALGLLNGTKLAGESNYLILNTYLRVRKKWYQTGIFRVIFAIVMIVVSVIFPPAGGLGAKIGLLGANAQVGAVIGLTGAAAAVAGAIANAIASMVLSTLIMKGSQKLFGDKLGSIIGSIVSFAAMQYGQQYATHGNFDVDWSSLMRADNLIRLTNAVGSAYTQWLNADLQSIQGEMVKAEEEHSEEMGQIQKAMDDLMGPMAGLIDPMLLTDSALVYPESSETYLNRTLLTGSDIAELSFSMIENFPDMSRELPKAFA